MSTTDRTSVADIVYDTLHAFWQGRITMAQAQVIKDLAKTYALLTVRDTAPLPVLTATVVEPDDADIARLARLMGQKEWTPRDLRTLAIDHGLFKPWLTGDDQPATWSRFGRLCENAAGREFAEGVFLVRGSDRTRRYLIRPGAAQSDDWSI